MTAQQDPESRAERAYRSGKNITDNIYLYAHLSNNNRYPTLKELFSEQLGKAFPIPHWTKKEAGAAKQVWI